MARRRRSIVTPLTPHRSGPGLRWVTKLAHPVARPLRLRTRKFFEPPDVTSRDPFILHRRQRRRTVGISPQESRAKQGILGSIGERSFYRELEKRGLFPGGDFEFQSAFFGGRLEPGGIVTDFLFRPRMLVVRIQSWRWHQMATDILQRDDDQKQILEHLGYTVLD